MSTPSELKFIAESISAAPFSKTWSVIQIHDEFPPQQLFIALVEILAVIDQADATSLFKHVDGRSELTAEIFAKVVEFLCMLKYKPALEDGFALMYAMTNMTRDVFIQCLYFLLKDIAVHKKRAYLGMFLSIPDVPVDFTQDETIVELKTQLEAQQDQFKQLHKWIEGLKDSGANAATLKREIQQLEEEKQQVNSKLLRIRKKVETVPNKNQWIEAAKRLRLEQRTEMELVSQIREQKTQLETSESKYSTLVQHLKEVKSLLSTSNPDAFYVKTEEECQMNRFLAQDTLPKQEAQIQTNLASLQSIARRVSMTDQDLIDLEAEIAQLTASNSKISEDLRVIGSNVDTSLVLFRQQAGIIASKKEATLAQFNKVAQEHSEQFKVHAEMAQQGTLKKNIMEGDEFKRYISELRGKSTTYKQTKAQLASLAVDHGVLSRTVSVF